MIGPPYLPGNVCHAKTTLKLASVDNLPLDSSLSSVFAKAIMAPAQRNGFCRQQLQTAAKYCMCKLPVAFV